MKTLADYLQDDLVMVSIGLNPSLPSVREGFYFANPRNRFWRALNKSGLIHGPLEPGVAAMEILMRDYGMGFTDVVKRPTAGSADLRAEDYKTWAPRLQQKLLHHSPAIAWFHGKLAYSNYLKHVEGVRAPIEWGKQPRVIGTCLVFVTPNPSPANAAYSLDELVRWYRRLARLAHSVVA